MVLQQLTRRQLALTLGLAPGSAGAVDKLLAQDRETNLKVNLDRETNSKVNFGVLEIVSD